MSVNDLTDQHIEDTYKRVVQTDGTNLADGTGSLLPISFDGNNVIISGSLTATEYSVTSSVINIQIATLSGSTEFGDSPDDTHHFTGKITASGNIFASGDIQTDDNLLVKGDLCTVESGLQIRQVNAAGAGTVMHEGSNPSILMVHGDIYARTHVTASGNISSSGIITANSAYVDSLNHKDGIETSITFNTDQVRLNAGGIINTNWYTHGVEFANGHVTASGNISSSGIITGLSGSFDHSYADNATGFKVTTNNIYGLNETQGLAFRNTTGYQFVSSIAQGNGPTSGFFDVGGNTLFYDGTYTFSGNITASGKISGSATSNLTIGGTATANTGSFHVLKGDSTVATGLEVSGYISATHITASGNISASGFISTDSHITASGNISASGILTGEGLVISDDASITDDLNIGGDITAVTNINLSNDLSFANNSKIQSTNEANTHITLYNDDYWKFTANNAYVAAFASNGATFNEDGVANCNFRVESDNDQYALYIDGGDNTIELGRQATTHITASGNIKTAGYISASGNIYSDNVEILAQGSARVATITNTTQYWGPNDQGPYHTANWNQGTTPESNGNLIFTRGEAQRGFILPYSASLVGFDAITRMNSGEDVFVSMSLFTANTNDMDLANASSNAANFTLVHRCTGMTAGRKDSNSYMLTASCDIPLAPLSVIFPQIKIDASDDSASDVSSGDGDDNSMTCDLTYVIKIKRIKE